MGHWIITSIAGTLTAPSAPNAPNVTFASASAVYQLYGNRSDVGFQYTLNLPTTDANYSHLKEIYVTAAVTGRMPPSFPPIYAASFSGSTVTGQSTTFPQSGSAETWTLTAWVINDDGIASASPATITVTVNALAVTSISSPREVPNSLTVDPVTRLVYTLIGGTPGLAGAQVPQNVTYYLSEDGGANFLWIGWQLITAFGQEIQFRRVKIAEACKLAMVAGAVGGDATKTIPAASLPAGAVISAVFAVGALAIPTPSLITSLTVSSGVSGSFPYNAITPDGRQYYSIPSVSYDDTLAVTDPNCFFIRITAQDLDSTHATIGPEQQFAGTSVPCNPSHSYSSGPLMGDYGTAGGGYTRTGNLAYVRFRVYACNRVDQTPTAFSNSACAMLQTYVGSGAGYVDVLVANAGATPSGAIPGSRVTGAVANATTATSATTATNASYASNAGTATNATNATNANYVPGSGVQGAITAGTGALTTMFQVLSGSTQVCWIGQNGSNYGIWAANAWFGGTGPSNPKIWLDSLGNAHFLGSIESASTIAAPVITGGSINGATLALAVGGATVAINSFGAGSQNTGVKVTNDSGYYALMTSANFFINDQFGHSSTITGGSVGSYSASIGAGGIYTSGTYTGGSFQGIGVFCPAYGVSCSTLTGGAGGISTSGSLSVTGAITVGGYVGLSGAKNVGFRLNSTGEYIHLYVNGSDVGAAALDFGNGILTNIG